MGHHENAHNPKVSATLSSVKRPVSDVTDSEQSAPPAEPRPADGRSSRWSAHRAARREELIDAAITAVTRHGAGVGMDQIAGVARTSKPVIYRYFTDKTDLYRAVSQRVVGDVLSTLVAVAASDPPPRELIHAQHRRLPRAA